MHAQAKFWLGSRKSARMRLDLTRLIFAAERRVEANGPQRSSESCVLTTSTQLLTFRSPIITATFCTQSRLDSNKQQTRKMGDRAMRKSHCYHQVEQQRVILKYSRLT